MEHILATFDRNNHTQDTGLTRYSVVHTSNITQYEGVSYNYGVAVAMIYLHRFSPLTFTWYNVDNPARLDHIRTPPQDSHCIYTPVTNTSLRIANPDKDSTTAPSWYEPSTTGVRTKDARQHKFISNALLTIHDVLIVQQSFLKSYKTLQSLDTLTRDMCTTITYSNSNTTNIIILRTTEVYRLINHTCQQ